MADAPDHRPGQDVAQEDGGGTTSAEGGTAPEPQAHADGRTEGNHRDVASAEQTLQLGICPMVGADVVVAGDRVPLLVGGGVATGLIGRDVWQFVFGVHD